MVESLIVLLMDISPVKKKCTHFARFAQRILDSAVLAIYSKSIIGDNNEIYHNTRKKES